MTTKITLTNIDSTGDYSELVDAAYNTANAASSYANAAFAQANNSTDTWVRSAANSASSYANSGFSQANTATTNAATADQRAVTSGAYANAAFAAANSSTTVDGIDAVGFRNIPINSQNTAYTTVLADSGKVIFHPETDANTRTFTIPANSTVAYPNGTAITFINMSASNVTITLAADTMYSSPDGSTGSKILMQYGSATALKMTPTSWLISGSGLAAIVITQRVIFGYGSAGGPGLSMTNLVLALFLLMLLVSVLLDIVQLLQVMVVIKLYLDMVRLVVVHCQ